MNAPTARAVEQRVVVTFPGAPCLTVALTAPEATHLAALLNSAAADARHTTCPYRVPGGTP